MHVSYTTHIASLYYIENFSTYVVSQRSRSTPLSGTFERSHGIFHQQREIKRSKGQGQTSFPAKYVQLHVLIWYCSACRTRDVHVLYDRTGSNRFEPVLIRLPDGAVGAWSKVKGHRLIQLSVRVRVSNPNSVVCSEP